MSEDKECREITNHEEAFALANLKRHESNLARCYLDLASRAAKPAVPENYVDYQQRRGAHADIVDEAIAAYEQWLLDDDYDPHGALKRIIERMRERRALYAAPPLPVAQGKWLTEEDMAWLIRFSETCEDCDAGGYDVPKDRMRRLAEIGVVRSLGFGRYETTAFGNYVVETHFEQKSPLPLLTYDDHAKNATHTPPAAPKEPT